MQRIPKSIGMLALLAGCAKMPPVDFSYYPSRGSAAITVTQSFDCSTDKRRLVGVTSPPNVNTQYSADYVSGPWKS